MVKDFEGAPERSRDITRKFNLMVENGAHWIQIQDKLIYSLLNEQLDEWFFYSNAEDVLELAVRLYESIEQYPTAITDEDIEIASLSEEFSFPSNDLSE